MASLGIEELKRRRSGTGKRKCQSKYAFVVASIAILVSLWLAATLGGPYSLFWPVGISIGFALQKSRFCLASAFRDPILTGSTSVLQATILTLILSTLGFGVYQYVTVSGSSGSIQAPGVIHPVGIHTVLGALLFGIGMVLAGGCVSGMLVRIGEGFKIHYVVLLGFLIGVFLGEKSSPMFSWISADAPIVHWPQYLSYPAAVFAQVGVLLLILLLVRSYERRRHAKV